MLDVQTLDAKAVHTHGEDASGVWMHGQVCSFAPRSCVISLNLLQEVLCQGLVQRALLTAPLASSTNTTNSSDPKILEVCYLFARLWDYLIHF